MMKHLSEPQITVYRPNQRHELGMFRTWGVMLKNISASHELIWQLFKRDFLAGYKKSSIGFTWIFLSPLIGIISWVFMQKTGLLHPGDVGIPYPAYILIGTSMWGLFMGLVNFSSQTLTAGAGFIMQVNYPHEALLFKQVAQQLTNFTISLGMNLIILLLFGIIPKWTILFLPLVILPLFFLSSAIGLMVSMISVVAFDIKKVLDMLLGLLLFTTPIIYSDEISHPVVQTVIRWNPLTYLICSARDIVLYGRLYHIPGYFICSIGSLGLFLISWRLFYVSENKIIERMI